MINYTHSKESATGGVLYLSETEANWAALFDAIDLPFEYEPTTFSYPFTGRYEYWRYSVLEDKPHVYTPDFQILPSNRYVEIKNGNIDAIACRRVNDLARLICSHTVLIDGNIRNSTVYTFDGREPSPGWETSERVADHFAYSKTEGCNADDAVEAMLQLSAYETTIIPPYMPRLSEVAKAARANVSTTIDILELIDLWDKRRENRPTNVALPEITAADEPDYFAWPRLV